MHYLATTDGHIGLELGDCVVGGSFETDHSALQPWINEGHGPMFAAAPTAVAVCACISRPSVAADREAS